MKRFFRCRWVFLSVLLVLPGCRNEVVEAPAVQKTVEEPKVLLPFEEGDLWGYKTPAGEVVITPRYHLADPFNEEGSAQVADEKGWAYINRDGGVLVRPFIFDNGPDGFKEGLARFVKEGKMGFFAASGKVVIPASYDFAWPFENGAAEVCQGCAKVADGEHFSVEGGTRWSIDTSGNKLAD